MSDDVSGIRQETIMPEKTLPQAAFLGFAERSEQVRDAETVSLKWNVLGLKNVLLVNFLPIPLVGLKVGVALRFFDISKPQKITFRAESGEDIGFFNLQIVKDNPTPESLIALSASYGWFVAFVAFPSTPPLEPAWSRGAITSSVVSIAIRCLCRSRYHSCLLSARGGLARPQV
jgi:hypothetical protein